ncbi:uncharacterized protein SPAPADRAFT_63713 [Spathaspora passalidarum NRRL Y-27907]|uniref:AB hydrolase-1 domain-containing protein n=1 Tax=Spathaspora passalidarum (strain NRRL Y-27907 / 11-Y1) TaxID=619300 RepID=G3AV14_SPAPN|nr:uncharacterized protein SPAPADRAFT_63713 [Spathaspora passalidarum NRRL Y-27907]EGW30089.1 hypothetical protein SPAPADRAFT_63713 [Spathaspora passalidarum NRRL Y-27907]
MTTQTEAQPNLPDQHPDAMSRMRNKKNEFNDGRKRPIYSWKDSAFDWIKQTVYSDYSDEKVEANLLSHLPFFPESDGKRRASVINTDLGDGKYIHELFIENIEPVTESSAVMNPNGLPATKEVVLVHGYAASLGLFIDNFDSLSSIPGIKIHAIDLLGFGFSARPNFPHFPSKTKQDIYKVEDWFIDSIEEWRKKRNINNFVLIGHSFGGYLSCAYTLKYNQKLIDAATGINHNLVEKLILLSPVGVERHKNSLLKDQESVSISVAQQQKENQLSPVVSLEQEVLTSQEEIVHGKAGVKPLSASPSASVSQSSNQEASEEEPRTRRRKIIDFMWERNFSPFSIVRNLGPIKSKMISGWTTHRFAHVYYQDQQHFQNVHDYMYRIFNGKGSGEYALTRVLGVGALAKLPLLDRCPEKFVAMGIPTLWVYGDKDWMNDEAGLEMVNEINELSIKKSEKKLASFSILPNAGHHLYLDNPPAFAREIFKFLGFRR